MKRVVATLGTIMAFAGIAAFAEDAKPAAAANPATPAPAARVIRAPVSANVRSAEVPTAEKILEDFRKMSPEQRTQAKAQMDKIKQMFAERKAAAAGNPEMLQRMADSEASFNKSCEMFVLLDEVDAAKAAGDVAKQAAADKALEAKAAEFSAHLTEMMKKNKAAMEKAMAAARERAEAEAKLPGAAAAKEQAAYSKDSEIAVRASYVSVTADGTVYAACGQSVKQFGPDRKLVQEWTVPAQVVAADGKGGLYAVGGKKVAKLEMDKDGKPVVGPSWDLDAAVKAPTSMKISGTTILVGESNPGRCIHKISATDGKYLGKLACNIATCCGILDFDVDAKGNVVVANLGQHRVSVAPLEGDGKSVTNWGAPGDDAGKFCGCCNPVSVAVLPNGTIATSEKTITRIKIYSADGKTLLMNMPAKELGTKCEKLDIAVDAKSNIYVNDVESGKVVILAPKAAAGK